ncbi:MAG: hypothetical protein WAT19_09140 [Ferruginibacter sp.]
MKVEVFSINTPASLFDKVKTDIVDKKIKTWSIVKDANNNEYLTHNPEQWFKKALLKPSTASNPNRLILTVTWYTNQEPTEYIKGLYIGRFTEELLEHYRKDFSKLETFV